MWILQINFNFLRHKLRHFFGFKSYSILNIQVTLSTSSSMRTSNKGQTNTKQNRISTEYFITGRNKSKMKYLVNIRQNKNFLLQVSIIFYFCRVSSLLSLPTQQHTVENISQQSVSLSVCLSVEELSLALSITSQKRKKTLTSLLLNSCFSFSLYMFLLLLLQDFFTYSSGICFL